MKRFYMAVTVRQDRNESIFEGKKGEPNPGYYSYIIPVTEDRNIKSALDTVGGLVSANIYTTRKRAAEVVNTWNDEYKAAGLYLFDSPAF